MNTVVVYIVLYTSGTCFDSCIHFADAFVTAAANDDVGALVVWPGSKSAVHFTQLWTLLRQLKAHNAVNQAA